MGEGDVSDKHEAVAIGNTEEVEKTEDVTDKKEGHHDEVKEVEEDKSDDGNVEAQEMVVDKEEAKESEEVERKAEAEALKGDNKVEKEEGNKEEKVESELNKDKKEIIGEDSKEENKEEANDKFEEDASGVKEKEETEHVAEDTDEVKEKEEKSEEPQEKKGSKKRPRTKNSSEKDAKKKGEPGGEEDEQKTPPNGKMKEAKTSAEKKEKEPKEPKTPAARTIERPVRERKSVERLVSIIQRDAAKEFHVEKGHGTALKDIPNVAYKLSKRKTDDSLKLLHTILFGRRGKAAQLKINISRFSGFVWKDNEEKQMTKVKDKLEKCVKEKLIEFCDILDIQVSKASSRKEDIIANLIEFLRKPHATTSELLANKDQVKKRKRTSKSTSKSGTSSRKSQKISESTSKNGGETQSSSHESEDEIDEGKEKVVDGVPGRSDEVMSEQADSAERGSDPVEGFDEDKGNKKRGSSKSSEREGSRKVKTKKVAISEKISPKVKKTPEKSPSHSKSKNDTSAQKSSRDKRDESVKESTVSKKSASKGSTGKKTLKVKDKPKVTINPSDDELKSAICEILKSVDFNTATFTDILRLLAKCYDVDLTPRKSAMKLMIQDELTRLADTEAAAEDEENCRDSDNNKRKPSAVSVKG